MRTLLVGIVIAGNRDRNCPNRHSQANSGQSTQSTSSSDVYYPNCAAARQAGVTPILQGQPRVDRDGDGVACE
jgi:hypothetical protein